MSLTYPAPEDEVKLEETEKGLQPANVPDPCAFIQNHLSLSYGNEPNKMKALHGTTTLSFIYDGGIVVAVDSRATGGSYIFSQTVMKILPLSDNMVGTMAGGAADCQHWMNVLSREIRLHKFRFQQPLTVAAASKILANELYDRKGYRLSIGTQICGYDNTGPHIFYVDNDGSRIAGKMFSVGSGSTYAYGVLDTCYRHDMTKEEAIELGRKAIYHATFRDSGSGGRVTVCHISEEGYEFHDKVDVNDLHDFSKSY